MDGRMIWDHHHRVSHALPSLRSAIEKVGLDVGGQLLLPPVAVVQQLVFVVEQLLVGLCGELKVGALHEG